MKQLSRLRSLANKVNSSPPENVEEKAVNSSASSGNTPHPASGNVNGSGKPLSAPSRDMGTTKRSLFLEHGEEDERGCLEAVTAFLAAIAAAADKDGKRSAEAPEASPALLQTSKGAGSVECRDSARELLRYFGHAPLLHLEGVIWVKATGERVLCLGALSNWSLFLIPLRDPSFIGGMLHGFKRAKQNISDRIVEIPLRAIMDVTLVSGRERLKTFRSFQANSVSRPFRIVTTKAPSDYERAVPAATPTLESNNTLGVEEQHQFLLVGFEDISRLRHFLVLACESWAVRTGGTFGGPAKELLSCSPADAQRYLAGVFEAMTGSLRNQVDAQVELLEDLANELILDAAVKEAFFSSGDIFFEIARRLEAAAATAEAASAAAAEDDDETAYTQDGFDRNVGGVPRRDSWRELLADARLVSAAAAVLDAAFFHSLQFPQSVGLVGRPKPTALPIVAENLFYVYCALRRRIMGQHGGAGIVGGTERREDLSGVYSAGDGGCLAEEGEKNADGPMVSWDEVLRVVLDRVVRALNGMSDVIRLFNIENESLGLVRNLVGVGIGTNLRSGIQPAASDALAFLIRVNDRTVGLIEDLDRREKQRRQLEAERLLARGTAAASSPASESGKGRKRRSVFARLASLSPGSRSRRSLTPPLTPPGSPASQSVVHSAVGGNIIGGGLQHLLEGGRGGAELSRRAGESIPGQRRRETTTGLGFVVSPRGRKGGPLPPPTMLHDDDVSQQFPSRHFLGSAPVLLHSYAKLLNSLVCGSYNLRAAYFSSCEADVRNIGREGGYLDMLAELDGGKPRQVFGQTALFLHEILVECHL